MPLFPIFVKLEGRRGPPCRGRAGRRVARSADSCLRAPLVTVVAPQATPAIQELAEDGKIAWHQREFASGRSRRRRAGRRGRAQRRRRARSTKRRARRGILVNSVDDPDNCDFYYPAVVNRGDLQIAISTAGHSPALAQRIRIELEQQFGPEYASGFSSSARRAASCLRPTWIRMPEANRLARVGPLSPAGFGGQAGSGHGLSRRRGTWRSGAADAEGAAHPRAGRRRAARRLAHAGHSRADSLNRAHRVRRQAAQRAAGDAAGNQSAAVRVRGRGSDGRPIERGRRRHFRPRQRRDGVRCALPAFRLRSFPASRPRAGRRRRPASR